MVISNHVEGVEGVEGEITPEEVKLMLDAIPPRPDYEKWLRIASAVWSVLPSAEGTQLLHAWSPEETEGEYMTKHKVRLRQITIGTLVHHARQHGFSLSHHRAEIRARQLASRKDDVSGARAFLPLGNDVVFPSPAIRQPRAPEARPKPAATGLLKPSPPSPPSRPTPPDGWCPTCWRKWARALRPGACVCVGAIASPNGRHATAAL
jgi:hypothetical protein